MKVNCKTCLAVFNASPSRIKKGKQQFCSWDCRKIGVKGRHFSPHSEFKPGVVTWNKGIPMSEEAKEKMRNSLKKIMPTKKKVSYWKGKPLSLETRKKMSELRKGNKHWNWQGGKRKEHKIIRQSFEYKEWRKKVFVRDNFSCVLCGANKCFIEADHIKRFAEFPELRFSVENGRTLCVSCHRKTNTWGNKKLKIDTGI